MVDVGDKVLVFAAGSEFATAVPLSTPSIGDMVAIYNLQNETRIAVPTLTFGLGDVSWVTPNFDFAGFDFKLDFNFQLIPLILGIAAGVYGIVEVPEYNMPHGDPGYNSRLITVNPAWSRSTMMGDAGWFIAKWAAEVNLRYVEKVEIWEATSPSYHTKLEINPNNFIYPSEYLWRPVPGVSEQYRISFLYPNRVRISCIGSFPGQGPDVGHITGCIIRI